MVLRKLGLVAGVLVAWLATFVVMGGGLPPIDLAASAPSSSATPDPGQGGPVETATPIGPSVPTPTQDSSGAQASAIQEAEKLAGRHVEPLAVEPDLGALAIEYPEGLFGEGPGIRLDLFLCEHRALGRATTRIPHAGREVTDDQDNLVTGVLELPELL